MSIARGARRWRELPFRAKIKTTGYKRGPSEDRLAEERRIEPIVGGLPDRRGRYLGLWNVPAVVVL